VLDELAVLTRPGAESRRAEVASVAGALAEYRPTATIEAPATLDGGDVLVLDRHVLVGMSGRSNRDGLDQFRTLLAPHGYTVEAVAVRGCLHLKSAVTQVGADAVLLNQDWVDRSAFGGFAQIEIDPSERYAANGLLVGDAMVYPDAFPRTAERLRARGIVLEVLDLSELAKAEGAVTCCSLIVAD
jgi:dimethylargininase